MNIIKEHERHLLRERVSYLACLLCLELLLKCFNPARFGSMGPVFANLCGDFSWLNQDVDVIDGKLDGCGGKCVPWYLHHGCTVGVVCALA